MCILLSWWYRKSNLSNVPYFQLAIVPSKRKKLLPSPSYPSNLDKTSMQICSYNNQCVYLKRKLILSNQLLLFAPLLCPLTGTKSKKHQIFNFTPYILYIVLKKDSLLYLIYCRKKPLTATGTPVSQKIYRKHGDLLKK